ncbi:MAG: Rha family transcriptional regulator, partial [Desulfovibrio sp.]|nr:Rha family transcriptional regulator [Desulfovibrio sp.]
DISATQARGGTPSGLPEKGGVARKTVHLSFAADWSEEVNPLLSAPASRKPRGSRSGNLVTLENGKAMTTSLKVAEVFGKRHYVVLRAIAALDCSEQFIADNFIASEYTDATGRSLLNPLTLCASLTRMKTDDQITSHNMRGNPMTTSLKVAEVFGKEHKNVIQSIEQLDCSEEFRKLNSQLSSYSVPNNRLPYPMHLMTPTVSLSSQWASPFPSSRFSFPLLLHKSISPKYGHRQPHIAFHISLLTCVSPRP